MEGGQAVQMGARKILEEAGLIWPGFGVEEFSRWLPKPDRLVFGFPSRDTDNLFQLGISNKTWKAIGPPVQLDAGPT